MWKFLIALVGIAVLAFLYWTISPLFIDKEVDDAVPIQSTSDETTSLEPIMRGPFEIKDTAAHPATGSVSIIESEVGRVLRYENYNGTNGPDLKVYLATDLEASEYISLGEAKGNKGNINYEVPDNADFATYKYVLTWCEAFSVLFDYAELN